MLLSRQHHLAGVQPLELLQTFSKTVSIAIIVSSVTDFDNRHFKHFMHEEKLSHETSSTGKLVTAHE